MERVHFIQGPSFVLGSDAQSASRHFLPASGALDRTPDQNLSKPSGIRMRSILPRAFRRYLFGIKPLPLLVLDRRGELTKEPRKEGLTFCLIPCIFRQGFCIGSYGVPARSFTPPHDIGTFSSFFLSFHIPLNR